MLLYENSSLKSKIIPSYVVYYAHALLYNIAKDVFACYSFEAFVIKKIQVIISIVDATLLHLNKNVF
jgi:hypothetical protein